MAANRTVMIKRQAYLLIALAVAFTACVKDTYNMDKLSNDIYYSPTFGMSAVSGEISLSDILKPNDTVIFDTDKFIRIMFRQDSVINMKLADFYDLTNMVNYNNGFKVGDAHIADFTSSSKLTLGQMTSLFLPALAGADGTTVPFPSFSQTNINLTLPGVDNFTEAVFATGNLELSITNNLPVDLTTLKIKLLNSDDNSPIGAEQDFSPLLTGASKTKNIDLAGKRVTNNITAVITQIVSPGSPGPVLIDFAKSIDISISGNLLKVRSGHVKLPTQLVISTDDKDTVAVDPGSNVEIEKLKVKTGSLAYTLTSSSQIIGSFVMTLRSSDKGAGVPVSATIPISAPNTVQTGNVSLDNTIIDLSKDLKQPYNRLPVEYAVTVTSNGAMIDFNGNDSINIEFRMQSPDYDYVKGYFGQMAETISPNSIDLNLNDIISKITGDFLVSDPSITFRYSNSFGIPIRVSLNAIGSNYKESVPLGLSPFTILYPTGIITRVMNSSFIINKNNSRLPELISLPPSIIEFSGSASMNPGGIAAIGGRNNYLFGNSQLTGSVEVEVPMQFWINNLQLSDTVDNFLSSTDSQSGDLNSAGLDYARLDISVNNGFPLGLSMQMALLGSGRILKTVDALQFLTPAPVDASGKVTGSSVSVTRFELTQDFLNSADNADNIIFIFKINTTGNGANDVRLFSDYKISFNAAVVVKPEINLK
jgi:hypothetical protein